MYSFSIERQRKILEATEITYKNGILHPSRENPAFHDFVYMVEGVWDFYVNGVLYDVYPGDVFILPAGSIYYGKSLCSPDTKTIFIHSEVCSEDSVNGYEKYPSVLLNEVVHCQNEPFIKELFDEILRIKNSNKEYKDDMLLVVFQALLYYLQRCDSKIIIHDHDIVDESIEIMKKTPSVFYKETEIANMLFTSVKTLRNGFIKRYNKTFYRYQIDYKLAQAFSLLVNNPDIKVYEVAYGLGFCDEFHLSKTFKKKYGMSPSACKRKYFSDKSTDKPAGKGQ